MSKSRIEKEKEIIKLMVEIYCEKKHHYEHELCHECNELLDYATKRLTFCKFQDQKTSCRKCPVHCYKFTMKEKIKDVMRFSGPRLLLNRPVAFIKHWFY